VRRARRSAARGQIIVLAALVFTAVLSLGGIAVDGGNALYQYRLAQNAADFAALASTQALAPACPVQGSATVTAQTVTDVIVDVIVENAPDALSGGGGWTAVYTGEHGAILTSGSPATPIAIPGHAPAGDTNTPADAPAGACGTQVTVHPHFGTFIAGLMGFTSLTTTAVAKAVSSPAIPPLTPGIVALAPKGGHTILGGGSGGALFTVNGNIFDNSSGTNNYSDTVDTFGTSQMWINGEIATVATGGFDPAYSGNYQPVTPRQGGPSPTPADCEATGSGGHSPIFFYTSMCPPTTGSSQGYGGQAQINDPLAALSPPDPTLDGCSSDGNVMPSQTVPAPDGTDTIQLQPGEYSSAVVITGAVNVTFNPCGANEPGIYYFDKGLALCPAAGYTVSGANVLLYAAGTGAAGGSCGQSADAMTFGGDGTISFSAPTSGSFRNLVAWVSRSLATTNIGFTDDATSDGSVTFTGVVYAHSSTDNPPNGSTPDSFVSGYPGPNPHDCPTGGPQPVPCSGGHVTVNGVVVVDAFFTGGNADCTINYEALQIGGSGGPQGARLVQ
jgi:hypothetical protein